MFYTFFKVIKTVVEALQKAKAAGCPKSNDVSPQHIMQGGRQVGHDRVMEKEMGGHL